MAGYAAAERERSTAMHMADALISPAVGGTMWAAAAGLIGYCARRLRRSLDDRRVPLMGVLGAFVFAAQMVNFSIPATGSSGHLGGGLLLTILLGPEAAFITIASILTVQALFFADGGLLALGCNIINMGLFPCFLVYPLIYRPLVGRNPTATRIALAATAGAVVGLQLGAFGVVMETVMSGISDLPFSKFALLMQPIHLAIGVVEGLVTAAVIGFVWKARPEVLDLAGQPPADHGRRSFRPVVIGLLFAAALTGGVVSWFASKASDGLEWSIARTSGKEELAEPTDGVHSTLKRVQDRTAVLPDYDFAKKADTAESTATSQPTRAEASWGTPSAGTTLSGLAGGAVTLALALTAAWILRRRGASASHV
jgi:cobalt/nickel transport system permease protein